MPRKPCSVERCTRDAVTRGWCHGHYQRWMRLGDVMPERPLGRQVNFACRIEGCDRDAHARQLCRPHYRRTLAVGDSGQRVEDRIADAFNILLRYAPYLLSLRTRRRRFRCDGQLSIDYFK